MPGNPHDEAVREGSGGDEFTVYSHELDAKKRDIKGGRKRVFGGRAAAGTSRPGVRLEATSRTQISE